MAGSAFTCGRSAAHSTFTATPMRSASGATVVTMSDTTLARTVGCSFSSSGRAKRRKPLSTWFEALDLLADDIDVPRRIGTGRLEIGGERSRAGPRGHRLQGPRQLAFQQLQMDRHRIEGVLHLVRDARHQAAERRELAGVVERRVHLRHEPEIARDEHGAHELAVAVVDRVRHDHPLTLRFGDRDRALAVAVTRASARPTRGRLRSRRSRAARCSSPDCRRLGCRRD